MPQVTEGHDVARVQDDLGVEGGVVVTDERPPPRDGRVELLADGRPGRARRYSIVVSSTPTSPARAPASMLMLHTVMRPSIERSRIASPRYSSTWPAPPPVPRRATIASAMSLAVTPTGAGTVDGDRHGLGPLLGERLGGEDVLDLAGADAEGQRAEGAVGRRVRVAADDRHARLGHPELGADDVDDALVLVPAREQGDAELAAVLLERLELAARHRVAHRRRDRLGGHVVVGRGQRPVRSAHGAAVHPQALEGLRARHLVHEVQVDVEQGRLALGRRDDVLVPDLLEEGAPGHLSAARRS